MECPTTSCSLLTAPSLAFPVWSALPRPAAYSLPRPWPSLYGVPYHVLQPTHCPDPGLPCMKCPTTSCSLLTAPSLAFPVWSALPRPAAYSLPRPWPSLYEVPYHVLQPTHCPVPGLPCMKCPTTSCSLLTAPSLASPVWSALPRPAAYSLPRPWPPCMKCPTTSCSLLTAPTLAFPV